MTRSKVSAKVESQTIVAERQGKLECNVHLQLHGTSTQKLPASLCISVMSHLVPHIGRVEPERKEKHARGQQEAICIH